MNGPLRLRESGGVSGRLLDSAVLDRPKPASRLRALELAATAGAFVTTTAGVSVAVTGSSASALYKSVAMWICVGAVAGGVLAFIGSSLFNDPAHSGSSAALPPATPLVIPEPVVAPPATAEQPSEIAAEPAVPSTKSPASPARPGVVPPAPSALPPPPARPSVIPSVTLTEREKEASALANAREAVARGDDAGAIRTLDNYDATHPSGSLRAESAALRQSVSSKNHSGIKREPMTNSSGSASPLPK